MSIVKKIQENGNVCLYDQDGGCLSLCFEDSGARLLGVSFDFDGEMDADRMGALLRAAETESFMHGSSILFCDFPMEEEALRLQLLAEGFEITETDRFLSVKTAELLGSGGVKKALSMEFPNMEAYAMEELWPYQIDELREFLEKMDFQITKERMESMDPSLSAVTYGGEQEIRAVLFSSSSGDEILVEFLLGFSKKNPHYILSVCRKFAERLMEGDLKGQCPHIRMLSANNGVEPLLRRFLDKKYELSTRTMVLHAQKIPEKRTERIEDGGVTKDNIRFSTYQKNINEKYVWIAKACTTKTNGKEF